MNSLRKTRNQRGLSQRDLASKSGLSFRCIQQLEGAKHNWRVESLRSAARALNLPTGGLDRCVNDYFSILTDSIEDISYRIETDGVESWKLHLFNFVDKFRQEKNPELMDNPPSRGLDTYLQALLASTVDVLALEQGLKPPDWCKGIPPLEKPWFVSGIENLKATALVESPAQFRARNIFVLENFLNRV